MEHPVIRPSYQTQTPFKYVSFGQAVGHTLEASLFCLSFVFYYLKKRNMTVHTIFGAVLLKTVALLIKLEQLTWVENLHSNALLSMFPW